MTRPSTDRPDDAARPAPRRRADYPAFENFATRWRDNDVYGHVNNVVYYEYFDTAVNRWLIGSGAIRIPEGPVIGLVVETGCRYFAPIAFPDRVAAGIRVGKIGSSSVRYEVGLFREDADEAAAQGHFVHVYVDADSRRPTPLPAPLRAALETLRRD